MAVCKSIDHACIIKQEQVNDLRDRLQANVGVKQEFQQPQYQQNQNRKFSGQQQVFILNITYKF